jgi:hypothetical protein
VAAFAVMCAVTLRVAQDYWPTFTDASLIAAGTGALLWAVLADDAAARRTWVGLLGFVAIEAAVFARCTDVVVLGCAVVAVLAVRWRHAASVPPGALRWWLGSVVVFGAGVAGFDSLVYGGPLGRAGVDGRAVGAAVLVGTGAGRWRAGRRGPPRLRRGSRPGRVMVRRLGSLCRLHLDDPAWARHRLIATSGNRIAL